MPDLSHLREKAQVAWLAKQNIGADRGFPETMSAYRRNVARLADKAARDYTDARQAVLALIRTSGLARWSLAHMITDRLEDTIITVRRLFRYFEKIKSDPSRFPMDKDLRRRIDALETSIKDVRDAIVHLEEHIQGGEVRLT
jgi:hypothetical protein